MNTLDFILEWETGQCSLEREAEGFSWLFQRGVLPGLQGCYGRRYADLRAAGVLTDEGDVDYDRLDEINSTGD